MSLPQEKLPSPVEVIKKINTLKSLNYRELSFEDVEKIINHYFEMIPLNPCMINTGATIYRARCNKNQLPYNDINDIYITPKDLIKDYGRGNRPFQQIFYSSNDFEHAAFEVLQHHKKSRNPFNDVDGVTIGEYRVIKPLFMATLMHSKDVQKVRLEIQEHLQNEKKFLKYSKSFDGLVKSSELLLEFFADEFAKPNIIHNSDYMISVQYVNSILKSNSFGSGFDGVNYPGVAGKYRTDNQAIFKKSADEKLQLIKTYNVMCTGFDFVKGNLICSILNESNAISSDRIVWKGI